MIPRRGVALVAALVAASLAVFFFRDEIPEVRRLVLALAAIGFFFAPLSDRGLSLVLWLPAVAAVAWSARWIAGADGGAVPWLLGSIAGALLAVRGGGRAAQYYLPRASGETGTAEQRALRRQLRAAVLLYLGVYLYDGLGPAARGVAVARAGALFLAAVFFLRYLLLQAKFLGLVSAPLSRERGIVPAQRWPLLLLFGLVGGTELPSRLLPGNDGGSLLVTSALLFLLAGLVFVLGLSRSELPRSVVRWASFLAGMVLAMLLAAVLVELEGWAPERFAAFVALSSFVLVVLPFVAATTRLLEALPHASELVPRAIVGVMMAPVTAVNGPRWGLPSSGFLFSLAALVLVYWLVVALRTRGPLRLYLAASLAVMLWLFAGGGIAWAESGSAWQVFLLALGFALHAVDRFERWRVAKPPSP